MDTGQGCMHFVVGPRKWEKPLTLTLSLRERGQEGTRLPYTLSPPTFLSMGVSVLCCSMDVRMFCGFREPSVRLGTL